PAYRELNKKAFSSIWRDFKRVMDVNSYKNTSVKMFQAARKIIIEWQPNRELELMIKGANSIIV
uniref:ORF6C domain-containing protein n=1 Tax=Clostridium butyricum TaxID=1492 RepID=UPI0018AC897E